MNSPAWHDEHDDAPLSDTWLKGQSVHPVGARKRGGVAGNENLPAAQSVHTVTPTVIESQYVPPRQFRHADALGAAYRPGPHVVHAACPSVTLTWPVLHGRHAELSAGAYLPALQISHAVLDRFGTFPDSHLVQLVAPSVAMT
jgi:hypothetical protein